MRMRRGERLRSILKSAVDANAPSSASVVGQVRRLPYVGSGVKGGERGKGRQRRPLAGGDLAVRDGISARTRRAIAPVAHVATSRRRDRHRLRVLGSIAKQAAIEFGRLRQFLQVPRQPRQPVETPHLRLAVVRVPFEQLAKTFSDSTCSSRRR